MRRIAITFRSLSPVCLGATLSAVSAATQPMPRVEPLAPCFLEGSPEVMQTGGADCGDVVVPLFMRAGGPGQALTADAFFPQLFQPALLGPILVLVEQRGTLRSRPHLDCPEFCAAEHAVLEQRLSGCIARHAANGVDRTACNALENAADVTDLRVARGNERFVLYGASHGAELGQHIMRKHAEGLEAVVLDGAAPLASTDWSGRRARDARWGIDNLSRLRSGNAVRAADCNTPATLGEVLAQFEAGPITAAFARPDQPDQSFALARTEAAFARCAHSLQPSKDSVRVFPALRNACVKEGRARLGADMAAQVGAQLLADPAAQDAAVICSDDRPRSLEDLRTDGTGCDERLFARDGGALYVDLCRMLDLPQVPERSDQLATADGPTLVQSGRLDVQTPHVVSRQVVDARPDARHVVFPCGFYVQVANVNPCAIAIMRDFVADPGAPPDLTCVDAVQPFPFTRPDFTMPEGD